MAKHKRYLLYQLSTVLGVLHQRLEPTSHRSVRAATRSVELRGEARAMVVRREDGAVVKSGDARGWWSPPAA